VYPAKWDYHKGEGQMTTEVAIRVRPTEDIYLVLTGFDLDTGLANFTAFINPLILWVWIGFMVLGFGTLVCLIPQRVVDRLQWKPKTRLGRAADVSIVVTIVCVVMLGIASQARADAPNNGAATEHVPAGMGMGNSADGAMNKNRPANDTQARAMGELLCPCGCARQSILDCPCGTAADLRGKVMGMMANADLSSQASRDHAYDAVLAVFKADYGESVWATPRSNASWLFPALAALGGLALLFIVGRRFVARSSAASAATAATTPMTATPEDETYADKLDDELADTD
jgi:cytochrome c-type biogenesis protein CcmH/NrfF